jgi:hypothetical protein
MCRSRRSTDILQARFSLRCRSPRKLLRWIHMAVMLTNFSPQTSWRFCTVSLRWSFAQRSTRTANYQLSSKSLGHQARALGNGQSIVVTVAWILYVFSHTIRRDVVEGLMPPTLAPIQYDNAQQPPDSDAEEDCRQLNVPCDDCPLDVNGLGRCDGADCPSVCCRKNAAVFFAAAAAQAKSREVKLHLSEVALARE